MKSANELYLGFLIGAVSEQEIVEWAEKVLVSDDCLSNNLNVILLAELATMEKIPIQVSPSRLLKEIVDKFFGDFKIPSFETEDYARSVIREKCAGYLVGKIHQPKEILAVAERIGQMFNNPEWLGCLCSINQKYKHCANHKLLETELKNEVKIRLQDL